ncbi:VOC family protein [Roseibium sp. LAB1]
MPTRWRTSRKPIETPLFLQELTQDAPVKQRLPDARKEHPGGDVCFNQGETFSFLLATGTQVEIETSWNTVVGNCGQESMCGRCTDKRGVSWLVFTAKAHRRHDGWRC